MNPKTFDELTSLPLPLETGHPWNLSLLIIECDKTSLKLKQQKRCRQRRGGGQSASFVCQQVISHPASFRVFVFIYSPLSGSWNDTSSMASRLSHRTSTFRIHAPSNKLFCSAFVHTEKDLASVTGNMSHCCYISQATTSAEQCCHTNLSLQNCNPSVCCCPPHSVSH